MYCTSIVLLLYFYCTSIVLLLYFYCTSIALLLHFSLTRFTETKFDEDGDYVRRYERVPQRTSHTVLLDVAKTFALRVMSIRIKHRYPEPVINKEPRFGSQKIV